MRWIVRLSTLLASVTLVTSAAAEAVRTLEGDVFASLQSALSAAPSGAVLLLEGTHRGTFVIDRPMTLRGSGDTVLDGGGSGTVVTVLADGVRLENLTVTGSALSTDYWQAWGAAGIRVEGNEAVLSGLDLSGNAWGVVFRAGRGSTLDGSRVADNQRDGVLILGGEDHRVLNNRIERNRIGVLVDSYRAGSDRVLLPLVHDPAWTQEVVRLQASAVPALGHRIATNQVHGNAHAGIRAQYHVRALMIVDNEVSLTGITRQPDAAERAFWENEMRSPITTPIQHDGAGIALYCWPEDSLVDGNHAHHNLGAGILLDLVLRNRVSRNRVHDNAVGIEVTSASENLLAGNLVQDNTAYGIRLAGWLWFGQSRPNANLIHLNDLVGNGVNAFDGSDRLLSVTEIAKQLPLMPWPPEMRKVYENPKMTRLMAQQMVGKEVAGHNRWDDGTHGNRHHDFDEAAEGFIDRDGDGIGEVARPIPGGGAKDHRPLTDVALAGALAIWQP